MFEPYEGSVANAFRYRGVPVRFTYRKDANVEKVDRVDIDVQWEEGKQESRLTNVNGPWPCLEDALAEAQSVAAIMISAALDS